jgi:hypothetical protein
MDIEQKEELYKSIMMDVAKIVKRRINEAGNYYNQHNLKENFDVESIPEESALNIDDVKQYDGVPPYSVYKYFGDCKNTVDVDGMWNATEMSHWIYNKCEVVNPLLIIDKIEDGDRKIPKNALKLIEKLRKNEQLEDTSEIVCAMDDYQKIMFIYLSEFDTHYFFDCKA